jgi:hypothetical protein
MNPRITKGCRDLIFEIAKGYRKLPFSVLPYIIHSHATKTGHTIHWRHISCRLQVLLRVLKDYGLDCVDRKPKSKHGLKLDVLFMANEYI